MENKSHVLMQRYELGRLLGQGTFARVHYARSLITNQEEQQQEEIPLHKTVWVWQGEEEQQQEEIPLQQQEEQHPPR